MLDRILDELVSSFSSWRVDMGFMAPNSENNRVTQSSSPPSATRRASSVSNNNPMTSNANPKTSVEDPEYFQRILQSRYPEHMLHCPQTSLYPIFFFLMERWEARRAAAKQSVLPATAPVTTSESQNEWKWYAGVFWSEKIFLIQYFMQTYPPQLKHQDSQ